jgi:hypothetical protein
MGDMSLFYVKNRKDGGKTVRPRLVITQSAKQHGYVMWKYEILKNIAAHEPKISKNVGSFLDGAMVSRFYSTTLGCLAQIYDLTHPCGQHKQINEGWLSEITDSIAIAAWYMDNGSLIENYNAQYGKTYGHSVRFSMGTASEREVILVQSWLEDAWGIPSLYSIREGRNNNGATDATISINKREHVEKFISLVSPWVPECMKYKIEINKAKD